MAQAQYLMEHEEEARRLDLKTEGGPVFKQALWAGTRPGMRVADVGCGSGKTTYYLHRLVQPAGEVLGIDGSRSRVRHAEEHYGGPGIRFACRDFYRSLGDLGLFDFIWVRFVLEYHRSQSPELVANLAEMLVEGGVLFLADLDHNCLNHFGVPPRMEGAIRGVMTRLEKEHDFDPYAGRKLYSYLYDLGFEDIEVDIDQHHLIYGPLNDMDRYNWTKKIEVAARNSGYPFDEYPGGHREFLHEFKLFFSDPRRFTYTPIICCKGRKPQASLTPRS
jgi:SAM-dependent methyltransferase